LLANNERAREAAIERAREMTPPLPLPHHRVEDGLAQRSLRYGDPTADGVASAAEIASSNALEPRQRKAYFKFVRLKSLRSLTQLSELKASIEQVELPNPEGYQERPSVTEVITRTLKVSVDASFAESGERIVGLNAAGIAGIGKSATLRRMLEVAKSAVDPTLVPKVFSVYWEANGRGDVLTFPEFASHPEAALAALVLSRGRSTSHRSAWAASTRTVGAEAEGPARVASCRRR
jgi:hypothetical protein